MKKQSELVRTLPASWYCDETIYQAERETIFSRQWSYAAHERELKERGDYLTVEIAGYSLILIRQESGEIAAFHNVCRHRAAPLLTEPCGNISSTLTCKYHGWSYGTNGELVAAPYVDCSNQCENEKLSLFKVRVETFEELIFVNLSENGPSLHEEQSELFSCINESDCNFADYTFHSRMVREGRFNWKVWIEGYQECYHCPTIHPVFLKDFALQRYKVENRRLFSEHSCERRGESSSGSFQGLWLWVYPNLGMPVYEPAFYTLQVNPLSANRTRLTYTFHFRDPANEKVIEDFREFVDQITEEDINICEAVQKNLEAGIFKNGVLNPERENGVIYFHSLVRQALLGTADGATCSEETESLTSGV